MLGRLRMDVDTAMKHYGTLVKQVFSYLIEKQYGVCQIWGR